MRLADALQQTRREALSPPPLLTLSQWAATHARLPVGANAMPGRFEAFAYQRGWLDAITDPAVRQVTVMKSARVGYTRCLDHAVAYFVHQDPSPILFVMPRIACIRGMCLNHLYHHRGQLTVYFRLMGVAVPGLYGPSADEMQPAAEAAAN